MSCQIADDETIFYLVGLMLSANGLRYEWQGKGHRVDSGDKATEIAQEMLEVNHKAYHERCGEFVNLPAIKPDAIKPVACLVEDRAQASKTLDYYVYQAEHYKGWPACRTKVIMDALLERLLRAVECPEDTPHGMRPAGWNDAGWNFNYQHEPEPEVTLTLKQKRDSALSAFSYLKDYVSDVQLRVIRSNLYGEEAEYFCDLIAEITERVLLAPRSYEQDGKGEEAVAHFHYFVGGYDAYITELPYEIGEAHAYGYARFDHMPEGAGMGYISLEEIFKGKAEMDFHWEPKTIRMCKPRDRVEWERDVMDCIIDQIEVSNSDAQSIFECQGKLVEEQWELYTKPQDAASTIANQSIVSS